MSELTKPVPPIAYTWNYYQMTAYDMAKDMRERIGDCPDASWEFLQTGQTYLYLPPHGRQQVVNVVRFTPTRSQADAIMYKVGKVRLLRSEYVGYGSCFYALTPELESLLGVTHAQIVEEAANAGLFIPPKVRRHYPALFVEIPERFAISDRESAAERVTRHLTPQFMDKYPGPARMAELITKSHEYIRKLRDSQIRATGLNPQAEQDYEETIAEELANIDFLRWLEQKVALGGVFSAYPATGRAPMLYHTQKGRPKRK